MSIPSQRSSRGPAALRLAGKVGGNQRIGRWSRTGRRPFTWEEENLPANLVQESGSYSEQLGCAGFAEVAQQVPEPSGLHALPELIEGPASRPAASVANSAYSVSRLTAYCTSVCARY